MMTVRTSRLDVMLLSFAVAELPKIEHEIVHERTD
jgi:hypothetical protein